MITREFIDSGTTGRAVFSDGGAYRYRLERVWDRSLPVLAFVMCNPSSATEMVVDPTITRCLGFARAWGYGTLIVGNIFAFRSTDPAALTSVEDPVGPDNDAMLTEIATEADLLVYAWGAHGVVHGRGDQVRELLSGRAPAYCLGRTRSGHPRHPLRLRRSLVPARL